jgi:hypothetical protein
VIAGQARVLGVTTELRLPPDCALERPHSRAGEPRNTGTCPGNLVTVSPRFFPVTIDDSSDPRYQEEIR